MLTQYQRQAFGRAPEIKELWGGEGCIVVASGPSLTSSIATKVLHARMAASWRLLVVNDAYRLLPEADALYGCDWGWWMAHQDAFQFRGLKVTSHSYSQSYCDDKSKVGADRLGLRLVEARDGKGFGVDCLHYGNPGSSGFQAVNLALLMGASRIVLVGFDMRIVSGRSHFFGEHPDGLRRCPDEGYRDMTRAFPPHPGIINATPGSALTVYPFMDLKDAVGHRLHRDRPEPHARAG